MHNHLSHFRDSALEQGAGGATIDLTAEIFRFQRRIADTFPAQLTEEDHAELQALLVTLARLISDE